MKMVIFCVFCSLSFSYASNFSYLHYDDKDSLLEIIEEIDHPLIEYLKTRYQQIPCENFFFEDIDADADKDIIYSGDAGIEEDKTLFFLNEKDSFKLVGEFFGRLKSIKKTEYYSPLIYEIWDYPCCDENSEFIDYYAIELSLNEMKIVLLNRIGSYLDTVQPNKYSKELAFITPKAIELYNSPDENAVMIAMISRNTKGIILGSTNGGYYVMIPNDSMLSNCILDSPRNQRRNYSVLGWIKGDAGIEIPAYKD